MPSTWTQGARHLLGLPTLSLQDFPKLPKQPPRDSAPAASSTLGGLKDKTKHNPQQTGKLLMDSDLSSQKQSCLGGGRYKFRYLSSIGNWGQHRKLTDNFSLSKPWIYRFHTQYLPFPVLCEACDDPSGLVCSGEQLAHSLLHVHEE